MYTKKTTTNRCTVWDTSECPTIVSEYFLYSDNHMSEVSQAARMVSCSTVPHQSIAVG